MSLSERRKKFREQNNITSTQPTAPSVSSGSSLSEKRAKFREQNNISVPAPTKPANTVKPVETPKQTTFENTVTPKRVEIPNKSGVFIVKDEDGNTISTSPYLRYKRENAKSAVNTGKAFSPEVVQYLDDRTIKRLTEGKPFWDKETQNKYNVLDKKQKEAFDVQSKLYDYMNNFFKNDKDAVKSAIEYSENRADRKRKQTIRNKNNNPAFIPESVYEALKGIQSGTSFNISNIGEDKKLMKARNESPWYSPYNLGKMGGSILPIALGGQVISKGLSNVAPKLFKATAEDTAKKAAAKRIANELTADTIAGTAYSLVEEGLDAGFDLRKDGAQTVGERAKKVALDAALGLGVGVGIIGAQAGIKRIVNNRNVKKQNKEFDRILSSPDEIGKIVDDYAKLDAEHKRVGEIVQNLNASEIDEKVIEQVIKKFDELDVAKKNYEDFMVKLQIRSAGELKFSELVDAKVKTTATKQLELPAPPKQTEEFIRLEQQYLNEADKLVAYMNRLESPDALRNIVSAYRALYNGPVNFTDVRLLNESQLAEVVRSIASNRRGLASFIARKNGIDLDAMRKESMSQYGSKPDSSPLLFSQNNIPAQRTDAETITNRLVDEYDRLNAQLTNPELRSRLTDEQVDGINNRMEEVMNELNRLVQSSPEQRGQSVRNLRDRVVANREQQAQQRQTAAERIATVLQQRADAKRADDTDFWNQADIENPQVNEVLAKQLARQELPYEDVPVDRNGRIEYVIDNVVDYQTNVQKKSEKVISDADARLKELQNNRKDLIRQKEEYRTNEQNIERAVREYDEWVKLVQTVNALTREGGGIKFGRGQKAPSIFKKGSIPIETVAQRLGMTVDELIKSMNLYEKMIPLSVKKASTLAKKKRQFAKFKLTQEQGYIDLQKKIEQVDELIVAVEDIKPRNIEYNSRTTQEYVDDPDGLEGMRLDINTPKDNEMFSGYLIEKWFPELADEYRAIESKKEPLESQIEEQEKILEEIKNGVEEEFKILSEGKSDSDSLARMLINFVRETGKKIHYYSDEEEYYIRKRKRKVQKMEDLPAWVKGYVILKPSRKYKNGVRKSVDRDSFNEYVREQMGFNQYGVADELGRREESALDFSNSDDQLYSGQTTFEAALEGNPYGSLADGQKFESRLSGILKDMGDENPVKIINNLRSQIDNIDEKLVQLSKDVVDNRLGLIGDLPDSELASMIRDIKGEQVDFDKLLNDYMNDMYPERVVPDVEPIRLEEATAPQAKPVQTPKETVLPQAQAKPTPANVMDNLPSRNEAQTPVQSVNQMNEEMRQTYDSSIDNSYKKFVDSDNDGDIVGILSSLQSIDMALKQINKFNEPELIAKYESLKNDIYQTMKDKYGAQVDENLVKVGDRIDGEFMESIGTIPLSDAAQGLKQYDVSSVVEPAIVVPKSRFDGLSEIEKEKLIEFYISQGFRKQANGDLLRPAKIISVLGEGTPPQTNTSRQAQTESPATETPTQNEDFEDFVVEVKDDKGKEVLKNSVAKDLIVLIDKVSSFDKKTSINNFLNEKGFNNPYQIEYFNRLWTLWKKDGQYFPVKSNDDIETEIMKELGWKPDEPQKNQNNVVEFPSKNQSTEAPPVRTAGTSAPINQPDFAENIRQNPPEFATGDELFDEMPMNIDEPTMQGELPVNDDRLERGFNQTVRTSENTSEPLRDDLQRQTDENETADLIDNPNWYARQSNSVLMLRADALLRTFKNKDGTIDYESAKNFLNKKRYILDVDNALAQKLIKHYEKEAMEAKGVNPEQYDRAMNSLMEVVNRIAPAGTELGRAVQAFSIYNKLDVDGILLMAQKAVNKRNQRRKFTKDGTLEDVAEPLMELANDLKKVDETKFLLDDVLELVKSKKAGEPLTEAEADLLQRFEQQVKELEDVLPNKPSNDETIKIVEEIEPRFRTRDALLVYLNAMADEARKRLNKNKNTMNANPIGPWKDMIIIGANWMAKGVVRFADFSESALKEFGEAIRPRLTQLYKDSSKRFRKEQGLPTMTAVERAVNKAIRERKLGAEEADNLIQMATELAHYNDMSRVELLGDLQIALRNIEGVSFLRKLATAQTIAQLLNTKTLIRNVLGNELFWVTEKISKLLAVPIDMVASKMTGRAREIYFFTGNQESYWKNWFIGAKAGWKGYNPGGIATQYDLDSQVFTSAWNPMTYLEKALGVTLRSFDYASYRRAYGEAHASWAKGLASQEGLTGEAMKQRMKEIMATADNEVQAIFDQYGKYMTFQDETLLAQTFVKAKQAMNFNQDFGIGDLVLKYPFTPANLLMRAIDFSPVGIFRGLYQIGAATMRASKLGVTRGQALDKRKFVEQLSRGITGTMGFTAVGYYLAGLGILTGAPDPDAEVKQLQRSVGIAPYQVNFSALQRWVFSGFDREQAKRQDGDTMINYDWMQPVAVSLAIGTNLDKAEKEWMKDEKMGSVGSYFTGMWDAFDAGVTTLFQQPLIQGVTRLFTTYPGDTPTDKFIDVAAGLPSSFVPTAVNQARTLEDNQKRLTFDNNNKLMPFFTKVVDRLPFASRSLPIEYDGLGKPVEKYQDGSNNLFNVLLNPAFVTQYKGDKSAKTALEYIERTGDKIAAPRIPEKKLEDKTKLSREEFSRLLKITGDKQNQFLDGVDEIMNNPEFTDVARNRIYERALRRANERARREFELQQSKNKNP